jgi:tetratricopeptide (TPR) repeat protein
LLLYLLFVAVVVAAYYPALLGGFHAIDDPGIVSLYSSSPPLSRVLQPGAGYYYRPLLELSFWIDNLLWGMEPRMMHLENVLLHVANTGLVFALARRACASHPDVPKALPAFAALLFALHPVNVEAVGWVAGRTDPLLALFCLSSTLLWIEWLEAPRLSRLIASVAFFICAALTKETALAFLPVAALFALFWPGCSLSPRNRVATVCLIGLSVLLLIAAGLARGGKLNAVARLFAPGEAGPWQSLLDLLAAFGFYWKKMLLPLPLTFAITEVPHLYLLASVGVLLLLVLLGRWRVAALFFAASGLMILPALVLVLRNISWTPVAERYLYLPTAFFSLGVCGLIAQVKNSMRIAPLMVLLLLAAAVVVERRNALWQNQLAFFEDAVAKAPDFAAVHNELGAVHLRENQVAEAARDFATADRLNTRPAAKYLIKGNIMATMLAAGDFAGARAYFFRLFPEKQSAPALFLEMLQNADAKRLSKLAGMQKEALARDMMETQALLYGKTSDPFWLYQSGKLARELKLYPQALELFRKAYQEAPADASYRLATRKQISGLEGLK